MELESLPKNLQFIFIAMLESAIKIKEQGHDKKFFTDFASEIWETMNLSDAEYLKKVIMGKMMKDMQDWVQKNEH